MPYKTVLQGRHIQYHLNLCASDIDLCDPWKKKGKIESITQYNWRMLEFYIQHIYLNVPNLHLVLLLFTLFTQLKYSHCPLQVIITIWSMSIETYFCYMTEGGNFHMNKIIICCEIICNAVARLVLLHFMKWKIH